MKVVHLGPPAAALGGPAGYLLQLRAAFERTGTGAHDVRLPAPAAARQSAPTSTAIAHGFRALAGRVRRAVLGPPSFYRPSPAALHERCGLVDRIVRTALDDMRTAAEASFAATADADVLFAHDFATADRALNQRRPGQQVWLLVHSPMPLALYLAWNWGVPEWSWERVAALPDVVSWNLREAELYASVDRLIVPCREAADELVRADAVFTTAGARATWLMTGGSAGAPGRATGSVAVRRARWRLPVDQPVGAFVGNRQPYRGLDTLLAGLERLDDADAVPGCIAVAGPAAEQVPASRRVRPLGPVQDVAGLLQVVDFVVNVNRFSLFDLSTIEALEAGRPLLLHAIGGNRTFAALGAGCVPITSLSPENVAEGVSAMFMMSAAERERLSTRSRDAYARDLTLEHFARRHLALYSEAAHA